MTDDLAIVALPREWTPDVTVRPVDQPVMVRDSEERDLLTRPLAVGEQVTFTAECVGLAEDPHREAEWILLSSMLAEPGDIEVRPAHHDETGGKPMTVTHRRHYVIFESPGTMFHESTTKSIAEKDPALAVEMSKQIEERHGARPFAFWFETRLVHDPIFDGEGGELQVKPRTVEESGRYFLGGVVETLAEIEIRGDFKEQTLLSNMKGNGWPAVVVNTNSYKVTQSFGRDDVVVGPDGAVVARGVDHYPAIDRGR